MKHLNPTELATLVRTIVGSTPLAGRFNGVAVAAGDNGSEEDFLRILVHFKNLNDLSEDDVDAITSSIEGAILQRDDRFPSVRFSEP